MSLGAEDVSTERELVLRSQAGDTRAFGELVTRHMQRAYFGALGLVGSHDDALDLSQEAFARAYRARESIDPNRPFYAWVYQIVRRLCFNPLRDRSARDHKLAAAMPWLVSEAEARASADDPERHAERRELRQQLETALQELADHEREIFVLKEFEGLRYREIAELLDIPMGTVMSRLYSARQHLASKLEGVR